MSKPNKSRRKAKRSLGRRQTLPTNEDDLAVLDGRSVSNPLFARASETDGPASQPIDTPPVPPSQSPQPNGSYPEGTVSSTAGQAPGRAPNRTSASPPPVGQHELNRDTSPATNFAGPAAGNPIVAPVPPVPPAITAGQQPPNRLASPATNIAGHIAGPVPPATGPTAGPPAGQQPPNRLASPAGPIAGQQAPNRIVAPVPPVTGPTAGQQPNRPAPLAPSPTGGQQPPNRLVGAPPFTSPTAGQLQGPVAATQPTGQATNFVAGQPSVPPSAANFASPVTGQPHFQPPGGRFIYRQGPYVPPAPSQPTRQLQQNSLCGTVCDCIQLRYNRPGAEDENCFRRCASEFSRDCCQSCLRDFAALFSPRNCRCRSPPTAADENDQKFCRQCWHDCAFSRDCCQKCWHDFASLNCCRRPPTDENEDGEKCYRQCWRNFISQFSLNSPPEESTEGDTVVLQGIAEEVPNRHPNLFGLFDLCFKETPEFESTGTFVQETAIVLESDEEEPPKCGCCLTSCLDCFCYQPQVRTVPSPYNPQGTAVTIEQNTHIETIIVLRQDIVENLYKEVEEDLTKGLLDEDYDRSCSQLCDQAVGYLCSAPTCKCPNPFSAAKIRPKKEVMTKTLLKAKKKGYKMIRGIGYSFLEDFSKHIFLLWVIPEFILGLIGCCISVATVSLEQNKIFNFFHLSLIILATGFATIDFFETLFKSFKPSCKRCVNCRRKKKVISVEEENSNRSNMDSLSKGSFNEDIFETDASDEEIKITEIDEVSDDEEKLTEDPQSSDHEEEINDENERCSCYKNKCRPFCKAATDGIRIILTEVVLYPLLICDIFELTTGRAFESTSHIDRLGAFLFIVSCIYFVLYVYIARIIILVGLIRNVTDIRTPERTSERKDARTERFYNRNARRTAIWYQTSFTVHMILQMLVQVLMLIAIGAKVRYDNRHFYQTDLEDSDEELEIHVSGHLWFMIISGFFLPFMGFISFFVVTFYWSQEFPIGIYVDMISLMKMTNCGGEDVMKFTEKIDDKKEMAQKIVSHFRKLDSDFHNLRKINLFSKLTYPFKKPGLIIICMVYTAILVGFVLCACLTVGEDGDLFIYILNGGGWAIYYLTAVIIGVIANLYVLVIVIFWVIVLAITAAIVAILVAFLAVTMWCYFACICLEKRK